MSKKRKRSKKKDLGKTEKTDEILLPSELFSVNLIPQLNNTFLGFPLIKGATNNLWKWDTMEDVHFK